VIYISNLFTGEQIMYLSKLYETRINSAMVAIVLLVGLFVGNVGITQTEEPNNSSQKSVSIKKDDSTKSVTFDSSNNKQEQYFRMLTVTVTDGILGTISEPSTDSGSFWLFLPPTPFSNTSVDFSNHQIANAKSKEYSPIFSGVVKRNSNGGGGGGGANDYNWDVTGKYTISCVRACQVGPAEIKVPSGYDMNTDKLGIKKMFDSLFHKFGKCGECECDEHKNNHTVNWPAAINNEFIVSCGKPRCPASLGKIVPVDTDFEVSLDPDTKFEGRSNTRLGLLETGKIIAKSKTTGEELPTAFIIYEVLSGGDSIELAGNTVTASSEPGTVSISVDYLGKKLTLPITVVAPTGIQMLEPIAKIQTTADISNYFPDGYATTEGANEIVSGFAARLEIVPNDVSFNNLSFQEINHITRASKDVPEVVKAGPTHAGKVEIPIPKSEIPGKRIRDIPLTIINSNEKPFWTETDIDIIFSVTESGKKVSEASWTQRTEYNNSRLTVSKGGFSVTTPEPD
jgi:hypothetical protein